MRDAIVIRRVARPNELDERTALLLDNLDRQLFPHDTPYPKHGSTYWWLARRGSEVVGFAGLTTYEGELAGTGFLSRAGVLPAATGCGLQRRLIHVRVACAKTLGLTRLVSYTAPHNFASAANLLRCGFRFYTPWYEWGCKGALYFEKRLSY